MENSTQNDSAMNNICATCLQERKCENAFVLAFQDKGFNDIFASCVGFKLFENSGLEYICLECIETIISFYVFKEKAVESYRELLRKSTKTQNGKNISEKDIPLNDSNLSDEDTEYCKDDNSDRNQPTVKIEIEEFQEIDAFADNSDSEKILFVDGATEEKKWKCPYCPLTFSKDNHETIKHHKTLTCRGVKRKMKQHYANTNNVSLMCLSCEFRTTSENEFKTHYSVHAGSDYFEVPPKKFGCTKCSYESARKGDVQRHFLKHQSEDEVELFSCHACGFSSRYLLTLQRHFKRKHENEKERLVKRHKCDKCNFRTAYRYSLTLHILKHKSIVEKQLFYCNDCDFRTNYKGNLKPHMVLHRNREQIQKYICEICGFSTIYKKRVRVHALIHEAKKEKQHQDEGQCLKKQQLNDKGELLKCEQCDYRTNKRHCLKSHRRSHLPDHAVRQYLCDKCPYKSRIKSHMDNHMNRHKSPEECQIYKCEYCDFRTAYPSALKIHMLRHTDDKQFACDQCDFKTIYKKNYIDHQDLHKDVKDLLHYTCQHCDYMSTYKRNVLRHELIHQRKKITRRIRNNSS